VFHPIEDRLRTASELADLVLPGPDPLLRFESQYAAHRFWLDVETMVPDRARARIERIASQHRSLPAHNLPPVAYWCCEMGLHELAKPIAAPLLAADLGPPVDQLWLSKACQLAAVAHHLADPASARRMLGQLLPHASEHGNMLFGTMGSVARYLGLLSRLLGDLDAAERWLGMAQDANEKLGAVTWLVRTRLDLVELRFERAGPADERGRAALALAADAAEALGLATLAERAGRLRER
jgi:hypothetical protein